VARGRRSAGDRSAVSVFADTVAGIERGWPAGLTVLTGDDAWHLDRAQRALLDALAPAAAGEFARTVFGEDKVDVAVVVGAARSMGMFASRRVVLVRDADALEGDPAILEAYATSPPPDSYLLVRAPKIDQRRKLGKTLTGSGRLLRFDAAGPAGGAELERVVRAMATERGLRLGADAVGFLLDATAGNLYAVESELDKLRAWSGAEGGPTNPTIDDVRSLVASDPAMSGWEVADAVVERDLAAALAAARRLLTEGEEPIRLLGGLAFRARPMIQARALLDARVPTREIGSRLRLGWAADRIVAGAGRYSMEEMLAFPYHVAEADRALKSRGVDPGAVFERLVGRLIGSGTRGARRPGRQVPR